MSVVRPWIRSDRQRGRGRNRRPALDALETRALLAVITVTGTGDTIASDGVVTLREAITAANTNAASGDAPAGDAGLDTINFNIAGGGLQTINLTAALPTSTEPIAINGADPTGQPLIELNGAGVAGGTGLTLTGGGSTVRGLILNNFAGSGIALTGTGGNLVAGNYFGTNAAGAAAAPNGINILVNSPNNTIGGTAGPDRNIISGASGAGVSIGAVTGNLILGNYIGTSAAGTSAIGNTGVGILSNGANTTIGGTAVGAGNVISGNLLGGIDVTAEANLIQGNRIGTDAVGTANLGNLGFGVNLAGNNNTVGGTAAGAGNVIANTNGTTVGTGNAIISTGTGNQILGNSIFGGTGTNAVGIQASASIPTPVLTSATATTINGTLAGVQNTTYRVEFFATPDTAGRSAFQGQTLLGFQDVTTDASGNATILFTPSGGVTIPTGSFLTATATAAGANGATSAFSPAISIAATTTADLGISQSTSPANALGGQTLRYTVVVSNSGPDTATGVVLTSTLPTNATFVSATGGITPTQGILNFEIGTLASGESRTVTIDVRPEVETVGSSLVNTLAVTSSGGTTDPNTANNSLVVTSPVNAVSGSVPTVANDTFQAVRGQALNVAAPGVLGNDTAAQGQTLTAQLVGNPTNGTVTLNANGSFTYTPNANFTGTDTFTYRAANGTATSALGTVTINVNPPGTDVTGPTVTNLQRFGFHTQATLLVVTFSEPLAAATATNVDNYQLVAAGADGQVGTGDDQLIAISSVEYDAANRAVLIRPAQQLPLAQTYGLSLAGGTGGLTDVAGNRLDGDRNGTGGDDALEVFDSTALAGSVTAQRVRVATSQVRGRRFQVQTQLVPKVMANRPLEQLRIQLARKLRAAAARRR